MECPKCGGKELLFIHTPGIVHYGKEECAKCGRFIKWVKKPSDYHKGARNMNIQEDFEKILGDCEARYAVNSPVKGTWLELPLEDLQYILCEKALNLLNSKTPAERYCAAMDCVLITLELASKLREDISWQSRLMVEVVQQPKDPEVTAKECEDKA